MNDVSQMLTQVLQKIKLLDEKYDKISKVLEDKVVNSNYVETEFEEIDCSNQNINIYFTKDIFEVNEMVVDCGAPKTLIGESYLCKYVKANGLELDCLTKVPCKQKFRFGPSQVFVSTEKVTIPITLKS